MEIWELDFASRPLVNEEGKRLWELLICSQTSELRYAARCVQKEATRAFVIEHLTAAMAQANTQPSEVRLLRLSGFAEQACKQLEIPSRVTLKVYPLRRWLAQRERDIYPQESGYQPTKYTQFNIDDIPPQPLPDIIKGEKWAFVSLRAGDLRDVETSTGFGDLSALPLADDVVVPGFVLFSSRARAMAAWMQGIEPSGMRYIPGESDAQASLILDVGSAERWVVARFRPQEKALLAEGALFEQQKTGSQGYHFLAIQLLDKDELMGFWRLWDGG